MGGQLPEAGWYADPADAQSERWWDNTQWTEHTRPLAAPVEQAPIPELAGAIATTSSSGLNMSAGIPQFASMVEPSWSQTSAIATDNVFGATSAGFSFGNGLDNSQANSNSQVNSVAPYTRGPAIESTPAWYGQGAQSVYMPPPSNGPAIAGLVMSLVGLSLGGLIASIIGLRRARGFEAEGRPPVGRLPARWGLGLSIASITIGALFTVLWFVALSVYGSSMFNMPDTLGTGTGFVTQEQLEQVATQQVIDSYGEAPASVDCPSLTPDATGIYNCTATMADSRLITIGISAS